MAVEYERLWRKKRKRDGENKGEMRFGEGFK